MMMASERRGRQTAVRVHHVPVNRRRPSVVQHARVGGSAAHRARGAVVIAGETRVRGIMSGKRGSTTGEPVMSGRRVSVDHGGGGRQGIRVVMAARISRRILTRRGPGQRGAGHVSVHVAGEGGREIPVMMARHRLGPVGVVHGARWPVMVGHARGFRVPVMMVGVLSLVLLKSSHQSVPDVQIRGPTEIVGVLVHVRVRVAVEMSVDSRALGRGRLVMMLIRIQNLLNVLQLVFARGGRFLRQLSSVFLELLVQIFGGRIEQSCARLQQRAGAGS